MAHKKLKKNTANKFSNCHQNTKINENHTQNALSALPHKLPATVTPRLTPAATPTGTGFPGFFIHHPVTSTGPSSQVSSIVTGGTRGSLHTVMYKSYGWATGPMPFPILSIV